MPPLIGQLDYREWLRKVYEERKARDSFFSYRFLAEKVGMDHSLLIKVLQGERHLAEGALDAWVRFLRLDSRDEEYFRLLVQFSKARSARERTRALERLLDLQGVHKAQMERDQTDYFRDWRVVALRSIVGLDGRLDAASAGAKLDPAMNASDAAAAFALLQRLGMIQLDPDGRWVLVDDFVEAGTGVPVAVVREHQKDMLRLAQEAIDRHPPSLRQVSSATFTLALPDLEEARRRIRALRDSLLRLSSESRTPAEVFQFEAVLFPLTRIDAKRHQGRGR